MRLPVMIFLAVNLFCAILYAVIKLARREGAGVTVFFLFLPGLGFVIYFLPRLIQKLLGKAKYDRESLVQRFQIGRAAEHPNVREELSVVPVEDAMAVSGSTEKRALLLKQLKKDANENYKVLLAAENDEDSESVHYVAAAKMEAYRLQQQAWLERSQEYKDDPGDPDKFHAACSALRAMIEGSVLSNREQEMNKRKYCGLIRSREERGDGAVSREEYGTCLSYLVDLGEYEAAERLWLLRREQVKSEAACLKMIELFYRKEDWEGLRSHVLELREDRTVRLGAQGLERLRYWISRCEDPRVPEERRSGEGDYAVR